jgi:raffinose/stachyose/melibiose transport system substrate-binding protein
VNIQDSGLSRRRFLEIAGGLAVATPLLAACAGSSSKSSSSTKTGGNLDMWLIDTGTYGALFTAIQRYEASHSGLKINVTKLPNTTTGKQKLIIGMTGQQPPAIVVTGGAGNLKPYVDSGKVMPLEDALTKANPSWKQQYLPLGLTPGTYGGKLYAVPVAGTQPDIMFYSKPVYQKLGLEVPTTYGQLISNADKIKAAGIIPFAFGNLSAWEGVIWFSLLSTRIGGPEPFAKVASGDTSAWKDPSFVRAAEEIQKLVKGGYFQPGFESVEWANGLPDALLYTGKASMELMVNFLYNQVQVKSPSFVKDNNLGWFDFPAVEGGKGGPTDLVGNVSMYASITSATSPANQALAADFLSTVPVSAEYAKDALSSGTVLLSRASGPVVDSYTGPAADLNKYTYNQVTHATSYQTSWDNAVLGSQQNALYTNLGNVFTQQWSPDKFVQAMSEVK